MLQWLNKKLGRDKKRDTSLPNNSNTEDKKFDPRTRVGNLTDREKMDQGFNGKTFSINGRDVDF